MRTIFRLWHRVFCRGAIDRHTHREMASPHHFEAFFCRGCGATLVL